MDFGNGALLIFGFLVGEGMGKLALDFGVSRIGRPGRVRTAAVEIEELPGKLPRFFPGFLQGAFPGRAAEAVDSRRLKADVAGELGRL